MSKEEEKKEEKAAKPARVPAEPVRKVIMEEREPRAAMPTERKPKEIMPSTVKGKIEAIQVKKGEFREGIVAFYEGVSELYESACVQAKENRKAASAIFAGARDIQVGIRALQSSMNEKIKENADYVKKFYG